MLADFVVFRDDSALSRCGRDDVREVVRLAVSNAQPARYENERRRDRRYPFPHPIRLTPLAPDGAPLEHCEIVVIGKSVTEGGLDFYHIEAVPYRHAIAWLPCGPNHWVGLAVELTWCRFNGYGWYENGGKFLRAVAPLKAEELQSGASKSL
jgi:hypothetical protein